MTEQTQIMDQAAIDRALTRIAHEIIERNGEARDGGADMLPAASAAAPAAADTRPLCLLGVKRRGVPMAHRLAAAIGRLTGCTPPVGELDTTLYRDDMTDEDKIRMAEDCTFPCRLEDRTVIVVDDVLYTGRTARAAMEAVFAAGRPAALQLAVLVDRGHRELPIRADFVGKNIPTSKNQTVDVMLEEIDGLTGVYLRTDAALTRLPGFCDVHVHFREPGFTAKETIATGSAAAAAGGYTTVCTMPNTRPAADTPEHLGLQLDAIAHTAVVDVVPYAAITLGQAGAELTDMGALAPHVAAFSDDGCPVADADVMRAAMLRAAALNKVIAAHCEDKALVAGGYINAGEYAAAHNHPGICAESEWGPIARDIELAAETGCAYHVCHVSTARSVELIRAAKLAGVNITCETAPHYLLLDDSYLEEDGRFKMNPPLRSAADRAALIEALQDGTIDMIATDHAPHTAEEKSRGLAGSPFGIVGLETAFPLLYTNLVVPGVITLERLVELLTTAPRTRFGLPEPGPDTYTLWDLNEEYDIDPATFQSMGRATPFAGWHVRGRCVKTVINGQTVYER